MVWYDVRASCPAYPAYPAQDSESAGRTTTVRGSRSTVHGPWLVSPTYIGGPLSFRRQVPARSCFPFFHPSFFHSFTPSAFRRSLPTFCVRIPVLASRSALGAVGHKPWPACRRRIFLSFHVAPPSSLCSPHHSSLIPLYPPAPHPLSCSSCSERAPHQVMDIVSRTVDSLPHAHSRSFTSLRYRSSSSFRGIFKTLSAVRCHGRFPLVAGFPS